MSTRVVGGKNSRPALLDHDGHDDLVVSDNFMNLYVMDGQGI